MNPPNTDGVMELTEAKRGSVRTTLEQIRDAFAPTEEQPVCDTFYLVSTYNKMKPGNEINGDTAEALLK